MIHSFEFKEGTGKTYLEISEGQDKQNSPLVFHLGENKESALYKAFKEIQGHVEHYNQSHSNGLNVNQMNHYLNASDEQIEKMYVSSKPYSKNALIDYIPLNNILVLIKNDIVSGFKQSIWFAFNYILRQFNQTIEFYDMDSGCERSLYYKRLAVYCSQLSAVISLHEDDIPSPKRNHEEEYVRYLNALYTLLDNKRHLLQADSVVVRLLFLIVLMAIANVTASLATIVKIKRNAFTGSLDKVRALLIDNQSRTDRDDDKVTNDIKEVLLETYKERGVK